MSLQMIQKFLTESSLSENELSQRIFVPCLNKMNTKMGQAFREIKFVGGPSENGNDIEFYEVIGPDRHIFYTGIQVKKGDINQTQAMKLAMQGEQALEKNILNPATGHRHRLGRWIVFATGEITSPACEYICKKLGRYGKQITFWNGVRLSQMLFEHYHDESVTELGVDQQNKAICKIDIKNIPDSVLDYIAKHLIGISKLEF